MSSRRKFIGQISTIGVMAGLPGIFIPTQNKTDKKNLGVSSSSFI
jgi:hypothetical protein